MGKIIVPLPVENYIQSLKIANRVDCVELPFEQCHLNIRQLKELLQRCKEWVLRVHPIIKIDDQKIEQFRFCLRYRPIFVDFDLQIIGDSLIQLLINEVRRHGMKLMFSYHNYQTTPPFEQLQMIVEQMFQNGADLVKVACMAQNHHDVDAIMQLYDHYDKIVAISMGDTGRRSRVLALEKGLKMTYAAFSEQTINAPGQYTINQMQELVQKNYQVIHPAKIEGELTAPISKSWFQRSLVLSMLSTDASYLCPVDDSEDSQTVRMMIEILGATVIADEDGLLIHPSRRSLEDTVELNAGQSGLALRMMAFVATLFNKPITIHGQGTLLQRPLQILTSALDAAGVQWQSYDHTLPITITGSISKSRIVLDASASSQPLSGLLMTLPLLPFDTEVIVKNLTSRPYIDVTLEIMRLFGVQIKHERYERFNVKGNQLYRGGRFMMESDWSGASNFLVGAALSGEVFIRGLRQKSFQADAAIISVLKSIGAEVSFTEDGVYVKKRKIQPFTFHATHSPDLVPILSVLACGANGKSVIHGVNRLMHKESNRVDTVMNMIRSLGGKISHTKNSLIIHGTGMLDGGFVDGCQDHRVVMAAAIASTICRQSVTITDADAVQKSYRQFFADFTKVTHSI